jgi:ABC-2 type transport system permease protein
MLGSPMAFAWRTNRGTLLGWALGLGTYAAIMGALLSTMIEWLSKDESYQRILAQLGMSQALSLAGFLGLMGVLLGLAIALQVSWRVGAARAEEEAGRLEALLARPVSRLRWLGGHVLLTIAGAAVLLTVVGLALWCGAALAGSGDLHPLDCLKATFNTAPVVALAGGLAVLAFGLAPRLTVALPVCITVVGYVMSLLGPALRWPQWVLDLSPFTHLRMVPAQPWAATAGLTMLLLAAGSLAVGSWSFRRRDLTNA